MRNTAVQMSLETNERCQLHGGGRGWEEGAPPQKRLTWSHYRKSKEQTSRIQPLNMALTCPSEIWFLRGLWGRSWQRFRPPAFDIFP